MSNKFKIAKIDNNKMRDNILYFAEIKGIKIGEIERAIGRRLGYVSRWRKNSSRAVPVEDVYNIARVLGVTVEDIIESDASVLEKKLELRKELTMYEKENIKILENIKQQFKEMEHIKQYIKKLESEI